MGVAAVDPAAWFAARVDPVRVAARRATFRAHPERARVETVGSVETPVVDVLAALASLASPRIVGDSFLSASEHLATDLFVARRHDARVVAVAVAFPSGFAPEAIVGHPVDAVHAVVPTLAETLGPSIHAFLERLPEGRAFARTNPGLTHGFGLDRHPESNSPRIDASTSLESVVLRLEDQLFWGLTEHVLFAVHVRELAFGSLELTDRRRLARWAISMPSDVAAYKGITPVVFRFHEFLRN